VHQACPLDEIFGLGWFRALRFTRKPTLFEINRFAATGASVRPIELVRKYFPFLSAFRAFANKRFKIFKSRKSGAVLGGIGHLFLLSIE
jgi:hypothetical protein